jgi:hypothetical protein
MFAGLAVQSLEDADKKRENILRAIRLFNNELAQMDSVEIHYTKEHLFVLLWNLLDLLIKNRQNDYVAEILEAWQGDPPDEKASQNLMIMANGGSGPIYAIDDLSESFKSDCSYSDITEALSRFLDINVITRSDPNFQPRVVGRPGVPVPKEGASFERSLVEFYQIKRAIEELKKYNKAVSTITVFPWQNHPLQALILKETGQLLPFSKSLSKFTPFRPKSALLVDACSFSSTQEVDLVGRILSDGGVSVTRLPSGVTSAFLAELASENYDLIWYSGHAEFDHSMVHASHLVLSDNERLDVNQLRFLKPSRKSLFVLNVCDGAAAQISNGPYEFGIAALIANKNRNVISHLWPVNGTVALTFGTILAASMVSNKDYAEAFRESLLALFGGLTSIKKILNRHAAVTSDLIRTLDNNTSIDWSNFANYASPFLCV